MINPVKWFRFWKWWSFAVSLVNFFFAYFHLAACLIVPEYATWWRVVLLTLNFAAGYYCYKDYFKNREALKVELAWLERMKQTKRIIEP